MTQQPAGAGPRLVQTGRAWLAQLAVENLAVIEGVRLDFAPGFVVLTGETGVGKSILVDALKLLSGGRASTDLVRSGASRAVVEGVFRDVPNTALVPLADAGVLDPDGPDAEELLVRRVISRDGNSAAYVNDRRVSLGLLADVASGLVDIQGQHDQRSLLAESLHGPLLDAAGDLASPVAEYRAVFNRLKELLRDIADVESGRQEAEARAAFLAFALGEIEEANLSADEEPELESELVRLSHAESLRADSATAFEELYGSDAAILARLARVEERTAAMCAVGAEDGETGRLLTDARVLLEEAADRLRRFRDETRPDPERLAEVEARLARIEGIKRKYGRTLAEVLDTAAAYRRELDASGDVEGRLEQLNAQRDELLTQLVAAAERLHRDRIAAGRKLAAEAARGLASLAMPHARLEVDPVPCRDGIPAGSVIYGAEGAARMRFLLAANPGEEARPLARVASGGELSRIMLALKLALIDADPVPCLVFDEVDAGIGGSVAEQVGRMLKALGARHQVFCVTHLPQIASLADHHLRVTKETDGERTRTRVTPLQAADRVAEVARMLGGVNVTATTLEHAREMLATG